MSAVRAITLTQPSAYLAGVVAGDGWCTRTLGLRVADEDFARAFSGAVRKIAPEVLARVAQDERGYWLVRSSNKTGRWDYLRDLRIAGVPATRAWLLGLFDSEGNVSLRDLPTVSANAKGRRVAFFSTEPQTLRMAADCLHLLGISTRMQAWPGGAGHLGLKLVGALEVRGSIANYSTFARLVGSNIERKQRVLDALPLSYQPSGHHARAQARGVAVRNARVAAGGRY